MFLRTFLDRANGYVLIGSLLSESPMVFRKLGKRLCHQSRACREERRWWSNNSALAHSRLLLIAYIDRLGVLRLA